MLQVTEGTGHGTGIVVPAPQKKLRGQVTGALPLQNDPGRHVDALLLPAGQNAPGAHAVGLVAPSPQNDPVGQGSDTLLVVQNDPAGHGPDAMLPTGQNSPTAHAIMDDPLAHAYPAGQMAHEVGEAVESTVPKKPAMHLHWVTSTADLIVVSELAGHVAKLDTVWLMPVVRHNAGVQLGKACAALAIITQSQVRNITKTYRCSYTRL